MVSAVTKQQKCDVLICHCLVQLFACACSHLIAFYKSRILRTVFRKYGNNVRICERDQYNALLSSCPSTNILRIVIAGEEEQVSVGQRFIYRHKHRNHSKPIELLPQEALNFSVIPFT